MKVCTKHCVQKWFSQHPRSSQWAWFVGLWCAGLGGVFLLTYPIKLLIRLASSG